MTIKKLKERTISGSLIHEHNFNENAWLLLTLI